MSRPMSELSPEELLQFLKKYHSNGEELYVLQKGETIIRLIKEHGKLPMLEKVELPGVDLCGVNLTYADLSGANFQEAQLIGTEFVQADIVGANFEKANLGGANFFGADIQRSEFTGANLAKVDFTEVVARGARFTGADIGQGALFKDANLAGADFSNSSLQGAKLKGANLTGTNLKGADLRNAEDVTCQQLRAAHIDATTKLPAYIKINWTSDTDYDCVLIED